MWDALEKIRESFKTEETEELETFVNFKLTARPEVFREMMDHMKYYEEATMFLEAEGVISALSVQENGDENAENVAENKTLEKLGEEKGPSSFFVQESGDENAGKVTENKTLDRKVQKNQSINSEKEKCKFLKFGKCRHGLSGRWAFVSSPLC